MIPQEFTTKYVVRESLPYKVHPGGADGSLAHEDSFPVGRILYLSPDCDFSGNNLEGYAIGIGRISIAGKHAAKMQLL